MARILIATTPVPGHVNPMGVLVRRLVDRGHEVVWHTGARFADHVAAAGARLVPIRPEHDWSRDGANVRVPDLERLTGLDQVRAAFKHLFIDSAPDTLDELRGVLSSFPADVVVADHLVLAHQWLSELGGPPSASIATTMYGMYSRDTAPFGPGLMPRSDLVGRLRNRAMNAVHRRLLFGSVTRHLDDTRERVGLPRKGMSLIDSFHSPYLYLQDCTESFEYPRTDVPPTVHFIGPLLPAAPVDFAPPPWWAELDDGRPVVLVTQGTVRNSDDRLFGPAFEALRDEDVHVVASTGGGDPDLGPGSPGVALASGSAASRRRRPSCAPPSTRCCRTTRIALRPSASGTTSRALTPRARGRSWSSGWREPADR